MGRGPHRRMRNPFHPPAPGGRPCGGRAWTLRAIGPGEVGRGPGARYGRGNGAPGIRRPRDPRTDSVALRDLVRGADRAKPASESEQRPRDCDPRTEGTRPEPLADRLAAWQARPEHDQPATGSRPGPAGPGYRAPGAARRVAPSGVAPAHDPLRHNLDQRQRFEAHRAVLGIAGAQPLKRQRPFGSASEHAGAAVDPHPGQPLPVVFIVVGEEGHARVALDIAEAGEFDAGPLGLFIDGDDDSLPKKGEADGHEVRPSVRGNSGQPGDRLRGQKFALPRFEHGATVRWRRAPRKRPGSSFEPGGVGVTVVYGVSIIDIDPYNLAAKLTSLLTQEKLTISLESAGFLGAIATNAVSLDRSPTFTPTLHPPSPSPTVPLAYVSGIIMIDNIILKTDKKRKKFIDAIVSGISEAIGVIDTNDIIVGDVIFKIDKPEQVVVEVGVIESQASPNEIKKKFLSTTTDAAITENLIEAGFNLAHARTIETTDLSPTSAPYLKSRMPSQLPTMDPTAFKAIVSVKQVNYCK